MLLARLLDRVEVRLRSLVLRVEGSWTTSPALVKVSIVVAILAGATASG